MRGGGRANVLKSADLYEAERVSISPPVGFADSPLVRGGPIRVPRQTQHPPEHRAPGGVLMYAVDGLHDFHDSQIAAADEHLAAALGQGHTVGIPAEAALGAVFHHAVDVLLLS